MAADLRVGIVLYVLQIMVGLAALTYIRVRSRKSSALRLLTALQALMLAWLLAAILENLSRGTPAFPFVVRRIIIVLYYFAPFWLLFTFDYLDIPWLTPLRRRLPVFLPAFALTVITLLFPHSPWIIVEIDGYETVSRWGGLFIANTVATYLTGIGCSVLILVRTLQTRRRVRESLLLVVSTMLPVAYSALVNLDLVRAPRYDLTPVTLSLFVLVIALLAYENKLLDLLPYAAREVFASVTEAILIADPDGAIFEFNRSFRRIFEPLVDLDQCRSVMDIRSRVPPDTIAESDIDRFREAFGNPGRNTAVFFRLRSPDGTERSYSCSIDPLLNAAGKEIGRLLMFHDITGVRDDTLRTERQRVSGDLHDSLGNSLNVISSNLEYAIRLRGDDPDIGDCLRISYERSTSAILDLRRIVDDLTPIDVENGELVRAIELLLERTARRGVRITFDKLTGGDDRLDGIPHPEHLYRICQEAVHNALEHGRPQNIRVVLKRNPADLRLYVSDDGAGSRGREIIRGRGLPGMLARASALGGTLEYGSPDDGGFVVKLTVPLPSAADGRTGGLKGSEP